MAQTLTKVEYPTGQDLFAPDRDMKKLAESVGGIVSVTNRAEADSIASAYNPTPNHPLYVHRADVDRVEVSSGNGWTQLQVAEDTGWVNLPFESGYKTSGAGGRDRIKYRVVSGWVIVTGGGTNTAESMAPGSEHVMAMVPEHLSPVEVANGGARAAGGRAESAAVHPDGRFILRVAQGSSNAASWIAGAVTYPLEIVA